MSLPSSNSGDGDDDRILSYHDEILLRSDLSILRSSSAFINDRLISFFFTHISLSLSLSSATSSTALLLPPSLSFLLSLSPADDLSILSPLDPASKTLILFPVNDNPDPSVPEGGLHWSLLIYERCSNEFVHHDSMNGLNLECAMRLYLKMKGMVGGHAGNARFVEGRTPRQRNGADCGLFVMEIARKACKWKEEGGEGEERWLKEVEEMDAMRVGQLRGELLGLIMRLMEEKRRGE